jgi:hypothetical protein
MKTEQRIRERLDKAYEMLAYYWSYLPEHFPEEYLSPGLVLPLPEQAELIVDRAVLEEKHGLRPPKRLVEAAKGFNETITTCAVLEWVLDLDSALARKCD